MKGSQEPTFVIAPSPPGFVTADGADAARFAARFGLTLDPWQADLCELWMRRTRPTKADPDGKWCAGTWGIAVPRQNGKNGTLEAIELYGAAVLGLRFIHTAHEVKTAKKHFRRMKSFFGESANDPNAKFPELNRLVKRVSNVNGEERIELWDPKTRKDRGSIEVIARSGGSGRGFTNDVLVFDEAQHLKDDELEASRPAISAAPSGDPVAIYMGTPPKPEALDDEGKGSAFMRIRNGAVDGSNKRAAWMEFGVEADLDSMTDDEIKALAHDRSKWARVNPALGRRLAEQTLADELGEMGPRSFCRERLNVWPVPRSSAGSIIKIDVWRDLATEEVSPDWPLAALGVDMDPTTGRLWVAPALNSGDPMRHVELVGEEELVDGSEAVASLIFGLARKRIPVVIPHDSPATVLHAALVAKGCKVYPLNAKEMAQASMAFEQAVREGTVSHYGDDVLEAAVIEAEREKMRTAPGLWRFKRSGELFAAPLYAAAGAMYGSVKWSRSGRKRGELYVRGR